MLQLSLFQLLRLLLLRLPSVFVTSPGARRRTATSSPASRTARTACACTSASAPYYIYLLLVDFLRVLPSRRRDRHPRSVAAADVADAPAVLFVLVPRRDLLVPLRVVHSASGRVLQVRIRLQIRSLTTVFSGGSSDCYYRTRCSVHVRLPVLRTVLSPYHSWSCLIHLEERLFSAHSA